MNSKKPATRQWSRSDSISIDLIWSPWTAFNQLASFSKVHKCMLSIHLMSPSWSWGYKDIPEPCTETGSLLLHCASNQPVNLHLPVKEIQHVTRYMGSISLPINGNFLLVNLTEQHIEKQLKRRCWIQVCPHSHERQCEQHKGQLQT